MKFSSHPFWSVGFRPFFCLAMLSGMVLPPLWVLIFSGHFSLPDTGRPLVQWHAHEMFYGFGWALLAGFLLTASKNWVGIRGYQGPVLIFLSLAWLLDRLSMVFAADGPSLLIWPAHLLFMVSVVALLMLTLLQHRHTDDYRRDNGFLLIMLPLFIPAKWLMLDAAGFSFGATMTLGLFRMAFLIMLERTVPAFMRAAFQVNISRQQKLDDAIKGLGLLMVAEAWLPPWLRSVAGLGLAILLFWRWLAWKPNLGLKRLDVAVMYLGYLALVLQLLASVLSLSWSLHWVGAVPVHLFTFGTMGLIIPSMIVRISRGHTGRKVVFDLLDKTALWLMLLAMACRLLGPQLWPAQYLGWLALAAGGWMVGFGLLAVRYMPYLWCPRVDGKAH